MPLQKKRRTLRVVMMLVCLHGLSISGMQEQCQKLRDERETAMRDLARLRCDCEAGNAERDRLAAELKEVKEELDK